MKRDSQRTKIRHTENPILKPSDAQYYDKSTILITGASMGLGRALALELAHYHTNLILCARSSHLLETLRDECMKLGANKVYIASCDVSDVDQVKSVVTVGLQFCQVEHLDLLLLNAGVSGSIGFENMNTEQVTTLFKKMWEVNFMGYVHFVHYCLPYLQKKPQSSRHNVANIGVISSMSGLIGVPYRTAYCSSKFAVNGFFEVLRNELNVKYRSQKDDSVRQVKITVVMPGWIDTGLRERHLVEAHHEQYKENDSSKVMSVEQCVHDVLMAIKKGKREERFILKQNIVPLLKALSPALVDHLITKHVNANTLEKQIASKL